MLKLSRRAFLVGVLAPAAPQFSWAQGGERSNEIRVISSGGFTAAYNILAPRFEQMTGKKIITAYGASMGNAPDAIPQRLARGEPTDMIILARSSLDDFTARGVVRPDSRVDLAESRIGVAVRAGAPKPDISTVDALKRTLLAAPSIAYSASASGTYYETELLKKLGIEDQVKPKSKRILSERVGTVVARGDAALGLQQVSELLPIAGIDYIGPLPAEVQRVTVFSAGIATASKQPEAARQLIRYLNAPAAAPTIAKTGLEPMSAR